VIHLSQSRKRMNAFISRAISKLQLSALFKALVFDTRANMMNDAADMMGTLILIGSVGGIAFVLVSNKTAYVGTDPMVTTMVCIVIPVFAALGLAMLFLNRKH
jgi:hypothetical protein